MPGARPPNRRIGPVTTLYDILGLLHLLFMAALIGGYFVAATQRSGINTVMVWGARLQLLTGLALMGVAIADDLDVNHTKLGIKLLIALAVVALAEISAGKQKRGAANPTLVHIAGVLALVNVVIAVFV